jgi:outer membrane lipoprotein-sorting protein
MRRCNGPSVILRRANYVIGRYSSMLAAALIAPAAIAAPAPATGDLGQVQHFLEAMKSMTADFTQTDRAGKVLTGTLTLKKPGKIRFQYQQGVPILIVGDGKALNFIDYSVDQVSRWPVGNSPLGVLIDPTKNIGKFAHVVPGGDPRILSVEASDPKHPEYGKITLVFARNAAAPAGLMLQGWVALDAQNNQTTIRLSNQKYNVPVSDNMFRFNDPRHKTRGH